MYTNTNTSPLYVAIDIGKNVHCYTAYAEPDMAIVHPPKEVHANRTGFKSLQKWLTPQLKKFHPIIIGMEPTGTYHEPWAYAIKKTFAGSILLKFLNPFQVKRKRDQLQNGRQRKTDPIDGQAIAYCLRENMGENAYLPGRHQARFRLWTSEYRQVQKRRQRLLTNLSALMDRLWPGALVNVGRFEEAHPGLRPPTPLLLSRPFERQLLQIIIQHRPNPYNWKHQSLDAIQDFFRQHGRRCGPVTAKKVLHVVEQALLVPPGMAQALSVRLQNDLNSFLMISKRLETLKQKAETLVPHTQAAVLDTVPGIGKFLAAQYIAYVSDPSRFDNADQIWAFAGFDPGRHDSGDYRYVGKISKRGPAGFRSTLYQIGLNTSQRHWSIRRCKERALQRGKGAVGANIHAAHKANRICYHLLLHQVPFDPAKAR